MTQSQYRTKAEQAQNTQTNNNNNNHPRSRRTCYLRKHSQNKQTTTVCHTNASIAEPQYRTNQRHNKLIRTHTNRETGPNSRRRNHTAPG